MAYNLQSLITILQQILDPQELRCTNKPRLESLLEKAEFLQQILEKSPLAKIGSLESQIRDAVYEAEDIIESSMVRQIQEYEYELSIASSMISLTPEYEAGYIDNEPSMVRQMLSSPQGELFTFITPYLQKVTRRLESAKEQVMKLVEGETMLAHSGASSSHDRTPDHPDVNQATQQLESLNLMEGDTMLTHSGDLTPDHPDVNQATQQREYLNLLEDDTISTRSGDLAPDPDVHQATQQLESLKLAEEKEMQASSNSWSTGAPSSSSKNVLVGIDEDLLQLKDRLTNMERELEIIPIVGMGGVGKTTLARKLYEDPIIVNRFDARAWTIISQDYNMQTILSTLLHSIYPRKEFDQHANKEDSEDEDDIALYKSLYSRRYLIVLDDVWSTQFWDGIKNYFPNNHNGSRIVITTRESGVAKYADPSSQKHQVQLLNKSESWNLLRQLVFGEEDCPLVFQEIGQKIASDCGGLPLAIKVIGGLLSKIERSVDAWKRTGNNVIAAIAQSGEQFSSILSLSYNHLPNHLKPCFLYMGAFPEDYEMEDSRIVSMWVAEGFVKSNGERSLEEEAEDCLNALVDRNLFLVTDYKYGKPKRYSMHDMLRDLSIRKSDEDKFLHVNNGFKVTFSNPRRVRLDTSNGMKDFDCSAESMSLTRSVIGIGYFQSDEPPSGIFSAFRLLRVLDIVEIFIDDFPTNIFELVNLRFLAVRFSKVGCIPNGISKLSNLQTLIAISALCEEPLELWQLSELRNLDMDKFEFCDTWPCEDLFSVMKKLQIITRVCLDENAVRYGFFKSIPNIKRLGCEIMESIWDRLKPTELDLSHLHKLEILKFKHFSVYNVTFPCNIRKLLLYKCATNLGVLATLDKLEVLKLDSCEFVTGKYGRFCEEWELADTEEFHSLQFLYLEKSKIKRWIAEDKHFPRLRHLFLRDCRNLEEIPSGIGEIPTLEIIELESCSDSLVASAKRIEEEQCECGNDDLKLRITGDQSCSYWSEED